MDIRYCTITGADDGVECADLRILTEAFPFVEWGILSCYGKEGTPRFPSEDWIKRFVGQAPASMNKALHLCGDSLTAFLKGESWMTEMMRPFPRVQLNLNLYDKTPELAEQLATAVDRHPAKSFIFQKSAMTEGLYPAIQSMSNVHILFDASSGTGRKPMVWPEPIAGKLCGYAGGLTVGTVTGLLNTLENKLGNDPFWVDVESGVRNEKNHFSRQLAKAFLSAVEKKMPERGDILPRAKRCEYTDE